jgi:hypothetical protein
MWSFDDTVSGRVDAVTELRRMTSEQEKHETPLPAAERIKHACGELRPS